ncbi:MAG TPA: MBL fold metallo-hydrolase [Gaiellaceae bacterium]|nr:MBL fold metallo-hydrolase [Gaiellaceae bacterium]
MPLRLKIWGCRGSVATPSPTTTKYGGNTSCVEVLLEASDTALILDAGTGIRALGLELARRRIRHVHLFLTHLHLDHLEGLRFFAPLWDARVTIEIWGPRSPVVSLRDRILRSFSPPLFPLDLRDVPSRIAFHDMPSQPLEVDGVSVSAGLVLHPGPTLGFRVSGDGSSIAYLPDHEPALAGIDGLPCDWLSGGDLARGADLVLHDAQYSELEYEQKVGWGHSSVADAVAFGRAVDAPAHPLPPRPGALGSESRRARGACTRAYR